MESPSTEQWQFIVEGAVLQIWGEKITPDNFHIIFFSVVRVEGELIY